MCGRILLLKGGIERETNGHGRLHSGEQFKWN